MRIFIYESACRNLLHFSVRWIIRKNRFLQSND